MTGNFNKFPINIYLSYIQFTQISLLNHFYFSPDNALAHLGGKYGNATRPFFLDDVRCVGTEKSISDCPKGNWGIHNCDETEAAGVSCKQEDPSLPGRKINSIIIVFI